jgi:hypothetical protein
MALEGCLILHMTGIIHLWHWYSAWGTRTAGGREDILRGT